MRRAFRLLLLTTAVVGAAMPLAAQDDTSVKEQLALQLIEKTGGEAMAQQVMDTMWAQLKPAFPTVPEEIWDEFGGALDSGDLPGLLVPIYVRYYSEEDMRGLIEFFDSPLGQRLIELQPAIMQDSMAAGMAWGRERFTEIIEELKQRGFEPPVT